MKKILGNNQNFFLLQPTLLAYCSLRNSEYNQEKILVDVPVDFFTVKRGLDVSNLANVNASAIGKIFTGGLGGLEKTAVTPFCTHCITVFQMNNTA